MKNYLSFALDVFGALILPGFGQFLQGRFRLAIAFFLRVTILEFCIILFANTFVLVCEMFNSVVEFVIDAYYKNKWAKLAKLSKDIGAGAVLISACMSAVVSLLIYGSKIYELYL